MRQKLFFISFTLITIASQAQTNPVILSWLQNRTGIKGRHYVNGNPTPINDADSANVQQVFYSSTWSYVRTKGIPAYITGPFLDGNPSIATNQNAIFKFPLNPVQNTSGSYTSTTGGNIGVFINGVALFDYRDGVSWRSSTNSLAGGPLGGTGDGVWNRDAVVAEKAGFDCSKGHPANGNYHHHQNPSAFNLDLNVISNICNIYAADGLYAIDSTHHSPLIGFAYDGFPIYGAYGYKNANGTGGIIRMKSSYVLRNITTRNTYANGTTVTAGPSVSATYPLGLFREDYQYVPTSASTPDYLDEHNGRFCVTPEYPNGIYCYFATVDANWNSAYPYVVGPTFYGVKNAVKVLSITEPVTQYVGGTVAVNLLSFNGQHQKKNNLLFWVTATETQCDKFEVERSTNGTAFQKIGEVKGSGTTTQRHRYDFTDIQPLTGYNYYRLRQISTEGKFDFSPVINLSSQNNLPQVSIFPNPASDLIVLQINDLLKNDMKVLLTNTKGQVVMSKDFYQGTTICFLETERLYEGIYMLTIVNGTSRQSYEVMIKR